MDIDEDDDFYADDNSANTPNATKSEDPAVTAPKPAASNDVEEEEDDDDEVDESDSVSCFPACFGNLVTDTEAHRIWRSLQNEKKAQNPLLHRRMQAPPYTGWSSTDMMLGHDIATYETYLSERVVQMDLSRWHR